MHSVYERFLAGDCMRVWEEIGTLKPSELSPVELSACKSVCEETVQRAVLHFERQYHRLQHAGYRFANPDQAFVRGGPQDREMIADWKGANGPMPLIVEEWYSQLRSIDFSQDARQAIDENSPFGSLGQYYGLFAPRFGEFLGAYDGETDRYLDEDPTGEFFLEMCFSSDVDEPCGFFLRQDIVDVRFQGPGKRTFVEWLRIWTYWGGFFLLDQPRRREIYSRRPPIPNFELVYKLLHEGYVEF